jgi:hypothetical protein
MVSAQWVQTNGPGGGNITALAMSGNTVWVWIESDSGIGTIYAGTGGGGVWRRPISEMVGIINDKQQTLSPISTDFNLTTSAQSNHNIAISFFLSQSQPVDLNIYNLSGREVARPVNRNLEAGKPAGCYAVRMQAGSHVYVKNIPVSR